MRRFTFIAFIVGLVLYASPAVAGESQIQSCTHTATELNCVTYLNNYDDDTIKVDIPSLHPLMSESISERIRGIDAAEIRAKSSCEKRAAELAREFVKKKLKNATRIDLINIGRDKYFRILDDVMVDGEPIGDQLLRQNLAYAYDGKTKANIDWCQYLSQPDPAK